MIQRWPDLMDFLKARKGSKLLQCFAFSKYSGISIFDSLIEGTEEKLRVIENYVPSRILMHCSLNGTLPGPAENFYYVLRYTYYRDLLYRDTTA